MWKQATPLSTGQLTPNNLFDFDWNHFPTTTIIYNLKTGSEEPVGGAGPSYRGNETLAATTSHPPAPSADRQRR